MPRLWQKYTETYESYKIEYYYLFGFKVWKRFIVTRLERPKEYSAMIKKLMLEDLERLGKEF